MITKSQFDKAISEFYKLEKRGSFYNMAVELLNNKFEKEAYFLILSTWNFARFRYFLKEFDIKNFNNKLKIINPVFDKLKGKDFKTINFDDYAIDIKEIYNNLSEIPGIEYTGASKIMHLKNRNIFVMWDGYIKGNKIKKYYKELEIVRNGNWRLKTYKNNANDYIEFLKDMQDKFKGINYRSNNKTFAKAIDEFNYVNITLTIQKLEKEAKG